MNAISTATTAAAASKLPSLLQDSSWLNADRRALRERAALQARAIRIPALLRSSSQEVGASLALLAA